MAHRSSSATLTRWHSSTHTQLPRRSIRDHPNDKGSEIEVIHLICWNLWNLHSVFAFLHWHQYVWMHVRTFCHIHKAYALYPERSCHMFLPLWKKDALRKSRPTKSPRLLGWNWDIRKAIYRELVDNCHCFLHWVAEQTVAILIFQNGLDLPEMILYMKAMYAWGPHKRISLNLVSVIQVAVCIVTPKREGFRLQSENRI